MVSWTRKHCLLSVLILLDANFFKSQPQHRVASESFGRSLLLGNISNISRQGARTEVPKFDRLPLEDKRTKESTKKDAYDDEAYLIIPISHMWSWQNDKGPRHTIIVHGQQHDNIGDRELSHMKECPHSLLQRARPKASTWTWSFAADLLQWMHSSAARVGWRRHYMLEQL